MLVKTPPEWNDHTILNFVADLYEVRNDAETVVLDFGETRWVYPFPALVAAEAIRELRDHRRARGLPLKWRTIQGAAPGAIGYLGHIGFFRHAHMNFGNAPGEASGSSSYVPFTVIRNDQEGGASGVMQEEVEAHAYRLARLIHTDESVQDMLAYCLREVIRNVFEHAETSECTLVAQKYLGSLVEVGIADRGRGVPASMAEAFSFSTPHHALLHALEPGASRVVNPGDQRWDNSGFGLYVLSSLGRSRGSFRLLSRGAAVSIEDGDLVAGDALFPGTAVKLEISVHEADYFPNELHQIVKAGEERSGAVARASASTRALSTRRGKHGG